MKSIMILGAVCIAISTTALCQKVSADKVPAAVKDAFKTKFAKAAKVSWEIEDKMEYEANFTEDADKRSAKFDKTGKWLETETSIKVADLPKAVVDNVTKKYKGYKIKEADKAETFDKGNIYEVEVEKAGKSMDVQVSLTGEILSK